MNSRYPNNTYFFGYTNFYHRKKGETKEAVEAIIKASGNAEKAGLVPLLLTYLHADTLFMDLQFAEAKAKYEVVLDVLAKTRETFAYTGQVVLSLAACNVWLGDDQSAVAWLKKVEKMYNPKSKNDSNSPKFAARVLKDTKLLPLMGVYILYINRDLAHMKPENAARLLAEMDRVTLGKDLSGSEVSGMHNLFKGVIAKSLGNKDEAMQHWGSTVLNEKKMSSDSVVLPYTYYEMGELEYRRGNLARAKQLFETGSGLKGEGHETLANRYNIAMKQLKRAMAEKK
jgi:tetratricopeptide (TPR) repeat protein